MTPKSRRHLHDAAFVALLTLNIVAGLFLYRTPLETISFDLTTAIILLCALAAFLALPSPRLNYLLSNARPFWRMSWIALVIASLLSILGFTHRSPENFLYVITSQAGEELRVFEDVLNDFERLHGIDVRVINRDSNNVRKHLKDRKPADVLVFDITWRNELLADKISCSPLDRERKPLIQPLSSIEGIAPWNELTEHSIPSSIVPALQPALRARYPPNDLALNSSEFASDDPNTAKTSEEFLFFLPYRINVKLGFLNQTKVCPKSSDCRITSWTNLYQRLKDGDLKGRVALQLGGRDHKALFLLELLRSAMLGDYDFVSDKAVDTLTFISKLTNSIPCDLRKASHGTVPGLLLTDRAYFSRNWSFTLHLIHKARREDDFAVIPGLPLDSQEDNSPAAGYFSNILGGDLLAIPSCSERPQSAIKLIDYLLSRRVQEQIVRDLAWPTMRLDAVGSVPRWLEIYQQTVRRALENARPTPSGWTTKVANVYAELFDDITTLCPNPEDSDATEQSIRRAARTAQARLDELGLPSQQTGAANCESTLPLAHCEGSSE